MLDAPSTPRAPFESYSPPKIMPLDGDAGLLRRMRTLLENAVANIPEDAYREPVVVRRNLGVAVAYLSDPDLVEEMLVRRWRDFPKSAIERRVFRPFLGDGLLTTDGEDWRWKRRLAAPSFSPAALARMTPALIGPFDELAASVTTAREADVDALMVGATLRVIERILFARTSDLDLDQVAQATEQILAPRPGWRCPGFSASRNGRPIPASALSALRSSACGG